MIVKPTGQEPTRAQIKRFIKIRERSGLPSNMQFSFDASEAGFDVRDLPKVEKVSDGEYKWHMSHGTLREFFGLLTYTPKP